MDNISLRTQIEENTGGNSDQEIHKNEGVDSVAETAGTVNPHLAKEMVI